MVVWRSAVLREPAAFSLRQRLDLDVETLAHAWRSHRAAAMPAVRGGSRPWVTIAELISDTIGALLEARTGHPPMRTA